jgi:hypothetical protein
MPAAVLALYFLTLAILAGLGLHRIHLLYLLHVRRRAGLGAPGGWAAAASRLPGGAEEAGLPIVTIQLPIYNEAAVAPRLLEAVGRLDWPKDRLEIQVLDDSTDDTTGLLEAAAARLRADGLDIHVLHRARRDGFKAGALAAGLASARGSLIAVFDADFVPSPSFLREIVPGFSDPSIGMVQARWGHLNREHSWLTRVQALFLDGHFLIEHAARCVTGRFFNFNGTAGVWRRACIEDAGGWQGDTLTEDLDLSYRAQLAGWRFAFRPATVAPAELPVEIAAFKIQQRRWAKGSIQTARKLVPRILSAPLPLAVRAEALVHLTANAGYLVLLAFSLHLVPAMLVRPSTPQPFAAILDVSLYTLSTAAFWIFYVAAEREDGGRGGRALRTMPALMLVGVGLSLPNARAVIEGLFSTGGTFERTPKHGDEDGRAAPAPRRYRAGGARGIGDFPWLPALLGAYFAFGIGLALEKERWAFLPVLTLFAAGHATMAILEWREARGARHCALAQALPKSGQSSARAVPPASMPVLSAGTTMNPLARAAEIMSPDPLERTGVASKAPSRSSIRARRYQARPGF